MKKTVIIVGCIVLFLCCIATTVGAGVWYFVMRDTPETAFEDSLEAFENTTYKAESETSMNAKVQIPKLPKYSYSMSTTVTAETKVDPKNDKMYTKAVTKNENGETTAELTYIGNDVYMVVNGGTPTKKDKSEVSKDDNLDLLDIIGGSNVPEHDILDEETIDGKSNYHYRIKVDDEMKDTLKENYVNSFNDQASGITIATSDVSMGDVSIEFWVEKTSKKVTKTNMKIKSLVMKTTQNNYEMVVTVDEVDVVTEYYDWGKEVSIEKPE